MSDYLSKRMAVAYDQIAPDFARVNAVMPPALVDLGTRFLALTGPAARVLDAGCGAGRDMAWLERQGADVTGADLSIGMLSQARRQARGPLLRMDLRALAFTTDSFAGVWCITALLHLPKAASVNALGEMHRVLRPAGVLALSVQEGAGEGWEPGPYGGNERFFARYTVPELAELLRASGFTVTYQARTAGTQRHWLSFLARCPANR